MESNSPGLTDEGAQTGNSTVEAATPDESETKVAGSFNEVILYAEPRRRLSQTPASYVTDQEYDSLNVQSSTIENDPNALDHCMASERDISLSGSLTGNPDDSHYYVSQDPQLESPIKTIEPNDLSDSCPNFNANQQYLLNNILHLQDKLSHRGQRLRKLEQYHQQLTDVQAGLAEVLEDGIYVDWDQLYEVGRAQGIERLNYVAAHFDRLKRKSDLEHETLDAMMNRFFTGMEFP